MVTSAKLDFKVILRQSAWRLAGLFAVATGVYSARRYVFKDFGIDSLPAGILGTALFILLGLKLNVAYNRWWEARQLWGSITNDSRSFARALMVLQTAIRPCQT